MVVPLKEPFGLFPLKNCAVSEPHSASDAARRYRMITCDHDDSDSCLPAFLNSIRHVSTGGIFKADESDEGQAFIGSGVHLQTCLHGAAQNAQSLIREMLYPAQPCRPRIRSNRDR